VVSVVVEAVVDQEVTVKVDTDAVMLVRARKVVPLVNFNPASVVDSAVVVVLLLLHLRGWLPQQMLQYGEIRIFVAAFRHCLLSGHWPEISHA